MSDTIRASLQFQEFTEINELDVVLIAIIFYFYF